MRALVLTQDGPVVRDHIPELRPGEATLRLEVGGVCATDLELVRGYMGFEGVLGHEWVGIVEHGPAPLVGKRVVGDMLMAMVALATGECGGVDEYDPICS